MDVTYVRQWRAEQNNLFLMDHEDDMLKTLAYRESCNHTMGLSYVAISRMWLLRDN
jgi:hypothetical protein